MSLLVKGLLGGIVGGSNQFLKKLHEEAELERQKALNEQRFNQNVELAGINHDYRLEEGEINADRSLRTQKEIADYKRKNRDTYSQLTDDSGNIWQVNNETGKRGLLAGAKDKNQIDITEQALSTWSDQYKALAKARSEATDPETISAIERDMNSINEKIGLVLSNGSFDPSLFEKEKPSAGDLIAKHRKANPDTKLTDGQIIKEIVKRNPSYAYMLEGLSSGEENPTFVPPPSDDLEGAGSLNPPPEDIHERAAWQREKDKKQKINKLQRSLQRIDQRLNGPAPKGLDSNGIQRWRENLLKEALEERRELQELMDG